MKFETRKGHSASGWQLAQAITVSGRRLGKGFLLDESMATHLGEQAVQVFQLEPRDIGEDEAARRLTALGLFGAGLSTNEARTGRINALAEVAGLLRVRSSGVRAFNARDEALTLATLPDWQKVDAGDLVATLKVIPFAVSATTLEAFAPEPTPLLELKPFQRLAISLIQTRPDTVKEATLDKGAKALAKRLEALGSHLIEETRIPHDSEALATALKNIKADLIVVFPGAATQDRRDVGPAGVELAGGRIDQVGMPVDPGNLLFLGETGMGQTVIGAPGCARSVAFNGFDWILERVCAGCVPTAAEIRDLGVGGLLKEIPSRPMPRLGV